MKTIIRFCAIAAAGFAAVAVAATVLAHAHLMNSTPAKGAVLSAPPVAVSITFAEAIQRTAGSYDITVVRDGGGAATSGAAVVDAADHAKLSVSLKSRSEERRVGKECRL